MRWKASAEFVDMYRRLTPEALSALQSSTDQFQNIPIPTGAVASTVNVILKADAAGFLVVQNTGGLIGSITLARGLITLSLGLYPIPVSPGDVLKFSYIVQAIPANNPTVYFMPR